MTSRSFKRPCAAALALAGGLLLATGPVSAALAATAPAPTPAAGDPATTPVAWGSSAVPAELASASGAGLAAGLDHTLFLADDGGVAAWGANGFGQASVPAALADRTVTQIAAGANHSLALTTDGDVVAWGRDGDDLTDVPATATRVLQIAAGGSNSLAVLENGSLVAWGDNGFGQNDVPATLDGETVTSAAIGSGFTLAATADGDVVAWGRSDVGQLEVPDALADEEVVQVAAGTDQALALTDDGRVFAWGGDAFGQADAPATVTAPGSDIAALAAGPYFSAALTTDGDAILWGRQDARAADLPDGPLAAIAATETGATALAGAAPAFGAAPGGAGNTPESLPGEPTTPTEPGQPGTQPGTGAGTGSGSGTGAGSGAGTSTGSGTNGSTPGGLALSGVDLATMLALAVAILGAATGLLVAVRRSRYAVSSASAASILDEDAASAPSAPAAATSADADTAAVASEPRRSRHPKLRRTLGRGAALTTALGLAVTGSLATQPPTAADAAPLAPTYPSPTLQQLVDNDFVLYFANAGTANPDAVSPGDHIGLFQKKTDQPYGVDQTTGGSWGFVSDANSTPTANDSAGTDKTASLRYDKPPTGAKLDTRSVDYAFDLPEGSYDVSFGFQLPSGWTNRDVDLRAEGRSLEQVNAPSGSLLERTYTVEVTDGTLDLEVHSPAGRTNAYTDPAVNYLIVRAPKTYGAELLAEKIRTVTLGAAQREGYADDSLAALDAEIARAQKLVTDGSTDTAAIRASYEALGTAFLALRPLVTYDSFRPGQAWVDDNGNPIQAHGGQVVPSKDADGRTLYYWYGEDRWNGYSASRGVHVYSSYDLYNWHDEGLALQAMSAPGQFEDDAYFAELYADYTAEQKAAVYRDLGTVQTDPNVNAAILERPKVIYNESTDQWVLWVHADGPSATSNAQYAKANAGVAVSDSPTGPFRYVDSYRLNVAPEGEPNYQPDSPGMARDMNLFVDTDKTGYIIYASEENLTLFVSKLSSNYMFLSTSVEKAEKGVDFTRTYIGGQREAPAVFLYQGTYYLITSGATGWNPNPAKYATATSMLGEWTDKGNPATGPTASTTHGSQSTSVIPIDPAAGKFIYMGDRWTPNDLKNAPAVWLPLEFGEQGQLSLNWYDEWTLDDLEGKGSVSVDLELPATVTLGDAASLPTSATVTSSGVTSTRAVTWAAASLDVPGPVTLTASVEGVAKPITRQTIVVPKGLRYLVDAGGAASPEYDAIRAAVAGQAPLLNSTFDQQLAADPATGLRWGSTNPATGTNTGSLFESLRYVSATAPDKRLGYRFEGLDAGSYDVYVGLYDPWSQWAKNRRAAIAVNGEQVVAAQPITGQNTVASLTNRAVSADGALDLTLTPVGSGDGTDVQLSWIMIVQR
jgi:hypothetical protein